MTEAQDKLLIAVARALMVLLDYGPIQTEARRVAAIKDLEWWLDRRTGETHFDQ